VRTTLIRAGLVAGFAALTAACSSTANLVVVLPEEDGHVGAVVVHDRAGSAQLLNSAYAAVGSGAGSTQVAEVSVDSSEVNSIFADALAAQPVPPASFQLYFETGTDVMTEESRRAFENVFGDIKRRAAADIAVTGHTDTVGNLTANDALALERAHKVRILLLGRGLPPGDVIAAGRGERELLVRTGDNVDEPRNRRVVITVR
jgi:outer membrane protein OmpA-like peptidoglycan-associated protein